ncbi:MAG: sugar phosphate nucleotidyltransferase, partial [Candidatus Latescibacterota bacterium]|nr:sugar phosphate nucleotidyltransferase [Candidatus Latescibacterota bacterium]
MQSSVSQAAILCGGLGTRLRPHTDLVPKPMVDVAGKPFLEHLMAQVSGEGVRRFVLMTGYLGDQIRAHFGDGSAWGWEITYVHGPVEWDTGRRLIEASEDLDSSFLLLYSDNWADLDLSTLEDAHRSGGVAVTVTLVGRDRGNIRFEGGPLIEAYVPSRVGDGLDHVEIGYSILERDSVIERLEAV